MVYIDGPEIYVYGLLYNRLGLENLAPPIVSMIHTVLLCVCEQTGSTEWTGVAWDVLKNFKLTPTLIAIKVIITLYLLSSTACVGFNEGFSKC